MLSLTRTANNSASGTLAGPLPRPAGDSILQAEKLANRPGFLRQGLWLTVSGVTQTILAIGQNIIVSRFYGPGPVLDAMSACNGIIRYCNDLLSGLQRAFLQNYVLLGKEGARAEQLFWCCQVFFFGLLAVMTAGTWIFRGPMLDLLYAALPASSRAEAESLLPILFLGLTFTVVLTLSNGKATARKRTGRVALMQVGVVGLTILATILFLPAIGLTGVLVVKAISIALATGIMLVMFKDAPRLALAGFRDLLTVSHDAAWLVVMGAVGGGIIFLENWFASSLPEGRLTILSWARQFALMAALLLQGGTRQVLSVYFQELVRDGRKAELGTGVKHIVQYSLLAGALVAACTVFLGRDGLQIVFGGRSWKPADITHLWKVCCVYSLVVLASCLGGLLVTVLAATKRFRFWLMVEFVRLGTFALFAWILDRFDLEGIAAAQVIQQAIGTGMVLGFVCWYLGRLPRGRDLAAGVRLLAVAAFAVAGLWTGHWLAVRLVGDSAALSDVCQRLILTCFCALPGLAASVWLGACWDISPMSQVQAVLHRCLRRLTARKA